MFDLLKPEEYVFCIDQSATCVQADDPCAQAIVNSTEEGQKVTRNNGKKFIYVARKKDTSKVAQSVFDLPDSIYIP